MNNIIKKLFIVAFIIISSSGVYSQTEQGIDAAKSGDYLRAVELLKSSADKEDSYEVYYYYGLSLLNTGSIKQAETVLNKALKKDDEGIGALTTLGDLYSRKKDYDKANSYYKKALAADPENIEVMLAQAKNLTKAGKLDESNNVLLFAKTLKNNDPDIYTGIGDNYYYRRAFKPAQENYNKSLSIKANNPKAHFGLGQIHFREKEFNDALDQYNEAIKDNPNFADAYLEKGRLLYFSEKYDEALTAFEKYSKLQPGSTEGLTYIAKVKYGQKKYDEALTILDDVVTKNPGEDLSSAYKYLAYVYNEKEEYDKALEYFLKVPKNIFDTEDYIKLAQIYYNKKDMDNAYKYFDEALIADSTDNTVFYQLGIMQFNDKKYENAITSFDRSIRLGTKQLAAYVYKGLSFYSLQKYEDALMSFDYANSIDNSYVPSWLWKARSEVALNKLDEARLSYNRVLELDPQNQSAKEDLAILDKK